MVKEDLLRRADRCLKRTVRDHNTAKHYQFWLTQLLQEDPFNQAWVEAATTSVCDRERAGTRRIAANALAFWFHCVAREEPRWFISWSQPYRSRPSLLALDTAQELVADMSGLAQTAWAVVLDTGLRPEEALALRVRDVCFAERAISVAGESSTPRRIVHMPRRLMSRLRHLLCEVRILHQWDCARGAGWAPVPPDWELSRPGSGREFAFQYLFPQPAPSAELLTGERQRHPLTLGDLNAELRRAAIRAKLSAPVSGYTLRHTYARNLASSGWSVSRLQEHLGQRWTLDTLGYYDAARTGTGLVGQGV